MIKASYKKTFTILTVALPLIFVFLQLIPAGTPLTNPPVTGEPPWDSPETRKRFFAACGDCHSHETRLPWYSSVAPVSWMIAQDVSEGRKHLNVSAWDRSQRNGKKAEEEVRRGSMPVGPYLLMHPEANFTAEEKKAFLLGLRKTFGIDDEHQTE